MKKNRSALDNAAFVETAINASLVKTCAYEVPYIPHNAIPLSVAINASGKKRLISDVSVLNTFIKDEKVKFEDYKVAKEFVVKDGCMVFDLTSGYHHISINTRHHTFLGFSWIFRNAVKYFDFSVLAFGIKSAPRIFTKTLRPMVKYWRFHG